MSTPRPCPACGATSPAAETQLREMMFGLERSFGYLTCPDCASLYIRDVPEDLATFYASDYYSFDLDPEASMGAPGARQLVALLGRSVLFGHGRLATLTSRAVPVRRLRTLVSLLSSVRLAGLPAGPETRVLDVGSGSGALVLALGLAGMRSVVGVDPFNEADRTLSTGAEVLRRDLGEVTGTFDLVMLHHSFEHVPDPGATLADVRRLLAPGGRLLVRMPTVSSAAYERYGADWIQLDPPRHLTLFSREGMLRRAAASGFDVVDVVDDSTAFQFWGSEQARRGIALTAPESHFVAPRKSPFGMSQGRAWQRQARELNRQGRGDQAVWVLTPQAGRAPAR